MVDGFLFDTNVLSELRRSSPARQILAFVDECPLRQQFVSVVTMTEIRFGVHSLRDGDKRRDLQAWIDNQIIPVYEGRVLDVTAEILLRWRSLLHAGRKRGRTYSPFDSLIAATALHHNLTLVTRNVRDFEPMGVTLLDPWAT